MIGDLALQGMMSALMMRVIVTAHAGWEGYVKRRSPSSVKQVVMYLGVLGDLDCPHYQS